MARVVESVQIFKKVEDVTAAKDDPSPVYLMDDLAEMARGSVESSEKIADRIAKRLQNKSPVVKFKALRLIRHLVNKGCGQFQRTMQRHASLVRDLIHFKGEPDPFKGDTPNQRVRDAAKEASESLFNTVMAQPVTSLGSRIQGFGSSAAPPPSSNQSSATGASGASASGSRMLGFGNSGSSYTAPAAASSGNGGGNFSQRGVNRPLTGSYGDTGGAGASSAGGYGGGGYTAPAVTATEVLGSEAQLVDSICTPGGLRLAPDPDDLRRFVEAAGSLDGLKLADLLRDKMDCSGPWQQLLRALHALEAVLLQGATQACGEIAVMFQSDPGPVQAATAHTQATVRERAGRVLKLLIGDDKPAPAAPAPAAAKATAAAPTAPQTTVDLLGGLDLLGSPVYGGHSAPQQHVQSPRHPAVAGAGAGPDDIFNGLAVPPGPPAMQQVPAQQPLGGLAAHSCVPAPSPQQQYAVPGGVSCPPVDPFASLGSIQPAATAPHQKAAYMAPQQNSHQEQQYQQWPMQQQQQAYGVAGGGIIGGGGGMMPQRAATSMVPGPALVSQAPQPVAAPPAQAAGVRPPLDDMFADMSLSSNPATGRPVVGPAAGGGPYGGSGGVYGGTGSTYSGGGMGYGNPAGIFSTSAPQTPNMPVPNSSGFGGTGPAGPANYNHTQGLGVGGAAAVPHLQSQFAARPSAPMHTAARVGSAGGVDLLGLGPSAAGTAMGPGADAWMGAGAGGYGGGAGVIPASGGMGMGPHQRGPYGGLGAAAPGSAGGAGGNGGDSGGAMMVGPGGHVRYVGAGGQPLPITEMTGAMLGPGTGHASQQQQSAATGHGHGGRQQPIDGMKQQQHLMSAGLPPQHPSPEQQRSGAVFDFARDHFR